jgi:hypothetical protein
VAKHVEYRALVRALPLLAALALPGAAAGACRQALALGLDVSGSVDAAEYVLQLHGLAEALTSPEVAQALLSSPAVPVWLSVYEWSGRDYQRLILDWTAIDGAAALDGVAARLRGWTRAPAPQTTALGQALLYGAALIGRGPACGQATLDISGDGKSNEGPRPRAVRETAGFRALVVNALVVAPGAPGQSGVGELTAYFRAEVLHGPGAFIVTAAGFQDYARAMKIKLLKELEGLPMGALELPGPRGG